MNIGYTTYMGNASFAQGCFRMDRAQQISNALTREEMLELYEKGERDFHDRQLDGIDLSGCSLQQINLSGSTLVGASLIGTNLNGSNLSRVDFSNSIMSRASLVECDFSWTKLSGVDLSGTDMHGSKARAAVFSNALMIRTKLNDADCLGAIMTNMNATAAQMESTNLECADLSGSSLMNANLCGANCSWANLSNARLNWAVLSWCLLEAADLENSNLTGANLQGANLSFSNLEEAIFTGADLYFANLSGALISRDQMPVARISSARLTSQTYIRSQWPKELLREWQRKGGIILDFEALPRDVQSYIREGDCNLRMYFNTPVSEQGRIALEVLIFHLLHNTNTLRILSVYNEKNKGQVAFYSPDIHDVELFISAMRGKIWQSDTNAIEKEFHNYQAASHVTDMDVIQALDDLSANIFHIQALVPVSEDDRTRVMQARLAPGDKAKKNAEITWSSVSLPKVTR